MDLEEGEQVLQRLEKGWYAVRHREKFEWSKSMFRFGLGRELVLTNKRLVFLKKGKVDSEIPLEEITKVSPDTIGSGNPYIRLRLRSEEGASIFFVCTLGAFYLIGKQKALTDRWVMTINNQIQKIDQLGDV